ncbi:hypothetical protein NW762_012831 [Fusarium torreyae]|uniref:DUF7136 domain-containing protein n=1 Tax=Fusarium torreyae TaxID=1237075 RepID=A0A9W8RNJ0_9HYPO|nr:hypothetical protein NW762_012831 [Fusarium torreyae]
MHYPPLHPILLACWFVLSYAGAAEEQNDATGLMKVDLVFPRNETYNPSPLMPIIFSYRNPGLAPSLKLKIIYEVWNYTNSSGESIGGKEEVPLLNSSSDPYFQHTAFIYPFNTEGIWLLAVHFRFVNCFEETGLGSYPEITVGVNSTDFSVIFTTKGPSKQIDLVAATSSQNCSNPAGITININDTVKTPSSKYGSEYGREFCPVVSSPPIEASSCDVTIGAAAASSISASMTTWACGLPSHNPPEKVPDQVDCPSQEEESAALRIVVGGIASLVFMLGALGYVL